MESESLVEQYRNCIGMFVVAERKNKRKAIGILKHLTSDNKLFIKGSNNFIWLVNPEEIIDFSARPDKFERGGNNHTH